MNKLKVTQQASGSDPFSPSMAYYHIVDAHIPTLPQYNSGERFAMEFEDTHEPLTLSVRRLQKEENRGRAKYVVSDGDRSVIAMDISSVRHTFRVVMDSQQDSYLAWRALLAINDGVDLKTFAEVYER